MKKYVLIFLINMNKKNELQTYLNQKNLKLRMGL